MEGGSSIEHDLFGDVFIFIVFKMSTKNSQKSATNSMLHASKKYEYRQMLIKTTYLHTYALQEIQLFSKY